MTNGDGSISTARTISPHTLSDDERQRYKFTYSHKQVENDPNPTTATSGECICSSTQPQQCEIPLRPTSTSQFFWSKVNGTFYFPISGSFSPVIRFFTLGPKNQTSLLATATGPNVGDITLNVEPASFAQEVYIGNASLVLAIAVFIFGIIQTIEIGGKIARYCILKERKP